MDLEPHIRNVPNFPIDGINFKDITTLLKDPAALKEAIDRLTDPYRDNPPDLIVAVEARGFIFATAMAYQLGCGFAPVRKPGKLPAATASETYELEYGTDEVQIHRDAVNSGTRVLIVDDLLATGGTAAATARLIERLGGTVTGMAFLIELDFLDGRAALADYDPTALIHYGGE
ncbi:MAG TPA: adenine phosphoribosyltransferase [Chloroflexota bacterium]|nr:adenine phosphoribosyltransferase [Chloroflexota bacterium]